MAAFYLDTASYLDPSAFSPPSTSAPHGSISFSPPDQQQSPGDTALAFHQSVAKFMEERGTPWPEKLLVKPEGEAGEGWVYGNWNVGGTWVELYRLWELVNTLGGWAKILEQNQVESILTALGLPAVLPSPHVVPVPRSTTEPQPQPLLTTNSQHILMGIWALADPYEQWKKFLAQFELQDETYLPKPHFEFSRQDVGMDMPQDFDIDSFIAAVVQTQSPAAQTPAAPTPPAAAASSSSSNSSGGKVASSGMTAEQLLSVHLNSKRAKSALNNLNQTEVAPPLSIQSPPFLQALGMPSPVPQQINYYQQPNDPQQSQFQHLQQNLTMDTQLSVEQMQQILASGILTPASSSEMFPTTHQELVSPMNLVNQKGMYRDHVEYDADGAFTPLISPAMTPLTQPTPGSATFYTDFINTPSPDFLLTSPALGPQVYPTPTDLVNQIPFTMSPHLLAQNGTGFSSLSLNGSEQTRQSSRSNTIRDKAGVGSSRSHRNSSVDANSRKSRPSPLMRPVNSRRISNKRDSMGSDGLSGLSNALGGIGEQNGRDGRTSAHASPFLGATPSSKLAYNSDANQAQVDGTSAMDTSSDPSSSSSSPNDSIMLPAPRTAGSMAPPPVPQKTNPAESNIHGNNPQTPASFLHLSSSNTVNTNPQTPSEPATLSSQSPEDDEAYQPRLSTSRSRASSVTSLKRRNSKQYDADYMEESVGSFSRNAAAGPSVVGGRKAAGRSGDSAKGKANASVASNKIVKRSPVIKAKSGGPVKSLPASKAAIKAAIEEEGGDNKKMSHKEAEQKRRDTLKSAFDDLRLLLPPIDKDTVDPDTGKPIAGGKTPRLSSKNSSLSEDNPNRSASRVALLVTSNSYLVRQAERIARRDEYIARLKEEISILRDSAGFIDTDDSNDILSWDVEPEEEETLHHFDNMDEGDDDDE